MMKFKLLSSDQIGKFIFFMFLLSKYYQYYSISGVAPRRKVGGGGGGVSKHYCIPNFSKWGLGTCPLFPYYFIYRPTIDILYIINYRRGHSLKFEKKKEKKRGEFFFEIGVPVQGRGACACTY